MGAVPGSPVHGFAVQGRRVQGRWSEKQEGALKRSRTPAIHFRFLSLLVALFFLGFPLAAEKRKRHNAEQQTGLAVIEKTRPMQSQPAVVRIPRRTTWN
jgi:hypothetical protein